MGKVISTKTGPRTLEGKKRSSINAQTHGLYTTALLPSESIEDYNHLVERLCIDWDVQCSTGEALVNKFASLIVRQRRPDFARTGISNSALCYQQDIKNFCHNIGVSEIYAIDMPRWFFEQRPETLQKCELAGTILRQAEYLASHYSAELSVMANTELRQLWVEVMGSPGPNFKTSITQRMCQVHGCDEEKQAASGRGAKFGGELKGRTFEAFFEGVTGRTGEPHPDPDR